MAAESSDLSGLQAQRVAVVPLLKVTFGVCRPWHLQHSEELIGLEGDLSSKGSVSAEAYWHPVVSSTEALAVVD